MSKSSTSVRRLALHKLKSRIISDLTRALAHASHRLALRAQGQNTFTDPDDLKHALSLLKLLPQLLPLLPHPPPPPKPLTAEELKQQKLQTQLLEIHLRDRQNPNIALGKHSRCPICLEGP